MGVQLLCSIMVLEFNLTGALLVCVFCVVLICGHVGRS